MAKNKGIPSPTDFARQQENIRKAKGNPNKNIHHKKKNSNYGGGDYQAQKASARMEQQSKKRESVFDMTPRNRLIFFILLVIMLVLLVLSMSTYKDNALVSAASALSSGVACCFLTYVGHGNRRKMKNITTFQSALIVVLGILGVLYVVTGTMGLINYFRG